MIYDDGFDAQVRRLRTAILEKPGELDRAPRREAFGGTGSEPILAAFCTKVATCAHTITDADIAELRAAGYTEDQIFEATVCAAVGAGLARLEQGLKALEGASP